VIFWPTWKGDVILATIKQQFETAAVDVKKLTSRPSNDQFLQLYALYKQGSQGDVEGKRPGFTDMIGRAKYDAWAGVKGASADEAMKKYVALVKAMLAAE
jgi:diazepam-binding inhibitor (GABA receptor modulating acyl-CoA-binding protein)